MIAWFTRNSVAANLLMLSILVAGVWSAFTQLTLEVFPDPDIDTVTINVTFRGATPGEVEEGVIIPIEEAIQNLEAIEEIRSTAAEGAGNVSAEIKANYDPRAALDDIKSRVDAIVTFPVQAEKPTVSLQQSLDSVVKVIIAGNLDERQLRLLADEVHEDILSLKAESSPRLPAFLRRSEDITSADIIGVRPYEIGIEISEGNLRRYDLTMEEVAAAVSAQSVDLSGGTLKTAGGEILLRTKSKAYTGPAFEQLVVRANPDGTQVTIANLGEVKDGFEESRIEARFNHKPAVLISVNRVGDQNAILISDAVKAYCVQKKEALPADVELVAWRDRSSVVKGRLDTLVRSMWQAFTLVFLILALFLRISLAFWVVLGIPVAFSGAIILMPYFGASINIASLFGFILVLGVVVDDAIVTGENIYSKLRTIPDPVQAAIVGTHEVTRPVVFGVLTTMIAFIPLLIMPGMRGAMFRQIPAVVLPVLLFSLIESKLILPAHLKHLRPRDQVPARWNLIDRGQQVVSAGLERFVEKIYQPFLEFCLTNRYVVMGAFIAVFLFTTGWWKGGRIRFTAFPRVASEYITASLIMPPGTPYEITAAHVKRMEDAAFQLQRKYTDDAGNSIVTHIFSSAGGRGIASTGGPGGSRGLSSGQSHLGEVSFELTDREDREAKGITTDSRAISIELRRIIGGIPGAEDFNIKAEIGRYGDPIDVQLEGNNEDQLAGAAHALVELLKTYEGLFDIASNVDDGKEEIRLQVKPSAQLLGIDTNELARQTRGAFFGFEAQRLQRERDDVRVMVRYPLESRESIRDLEEMGIRSPTGERVPFANLASLEFARSPSAIRRVDRVRTVNIKADADKEKVDLTAIKADLEKQLPALLAPYPKVHFSMEGESREEREAGQSLMAGCIAVLFLIFCMLAIPFQSLLQPLIVMSVIPFGLIGAVGGHVLLGHPLSFMSLFGILALSGVVVNDSLVLVDWINRKRKAGDSLFEAVHTGGAARFRPIILTSLTTFGGLIPLVFFEKSTQAQFLIPMAISLAFGIIFATAITLILIPVNYLILEDVRVWWGRGVAWFKAPFSPGYNDSKSIPRGQS